MNNYKLAEPHYISGTNALINSYYAKAINDLRRKVNEIECPKQKQNFSGIVFPDRTRVIIDEMSSALQVDRGLIFICWIASVCACTLGKIMVKSSEFTETTPLSLIIAAGFPSGYGKSQSLGIFTRFFTEKTNLEKNEYDKKNNEIKINNKLIKKQISILSKKLEKAKDEIEKSEILEEIKKLEMSKEDLLKFKKYIVGSITQPAYMKLLADQNFVIRLESDGGFLTKDHAMVLRKAWSCEPISEIRITRDDKFCNDPFIVDVVLTQKSPYLEYVQRDDFIETGVLSRTLHYFIDWNDDTNTKIRNKHEISKAIQADIHQTLNRIFDFSSNTKDKLILKLDSNAEDYFSNKSKSNTITQEDNDIDLKTRKLEYILRIAALLHIAESNDFNNNIISIDTIKKATDIMSIFYSHAHYSRNYISEESLECAKKIGKYVLDMSKDRKEVFLITDLKQKYKYKYDSKTVDRALKRLIDLKIITKINNKIDNANVGRPKSDTISVNIGYSTYNN